MRADGDRFRERARAVATLAASAAGALTAGLAFSNEGQSFPTSVKVAGIIGIAFLTISVCFFLSASLYYLRDEQSTPKVNPAADPAAISIYDRLESAKTASSTLTKAISGRTNYGKWAGLAGLFSLGLMLPLGMFVPEELSHVGIQITSANTPVLRQCPSVKDYVEGDIRTSDLSSASTLVPIVVSNNACDGGSQPGTKTLYLARDQVIITVLGNL